MATRDIRFLPKRTSVSGKVPTGTTLSSETNKILQGELALNTSDHSMFSYDGSEIFKIGDKDYVSLTGSTITGETRVIGNLSASTIFSGSTNLYDIFSTSSGDVTRVQPGNNIQTGGTANEPTISVIDSPSFTNIITSTLSGATVSGGTLYSGSTELSEIFGQGSSYLDIYDGAGGLTFSTSWTDITFSSNRKVDSAFSHTSGSAEITINSSGTYVIHVKIPLVGDTGAAACQARCRLLSNTASTYNEVSGTTSEIYIAGEGFGTEASIFAILDLNMGNKLKIQAQVYNGSSTIKTIANGSLFNAVKINSVSLSNSDPYVPQYTTLSDGATITWDVNDAYVAEVTLGGNRALSISNAIAGSNGTLIINQDATGNRTLSLPSGSKVVNGEGGSVTLSSTANATDILSFIYNGTNYFWTYGPNFT